MRTSAAILTSVPRLNIPSFSLYWRLFPAHLRASCAGFITSPISATKTSIASRGPLSGWRHGSLTLTKSSAGVYIVVCRRGFCHFIFSEQPCVTVCCCLVWPSSVNRWQSLPVFSSRRSLIGQHLAAGLPYMAVLGMIQVMYIHLG